MNTSQLMIGLLGIVLVVCVACQDRLSHSPSEDGDIDTIESPDSSENDTTSTTLFSVSGVVQYQGQTVENATVQLDNAYNLQAQTDSDGHFEILDVSAGEHAVVIHKTLEDDLFSERSFVIQVNADLRMNDLTLPKAVELDKPLDISDSSIALSWTASEDPGFREYKLYRHTTSGLDENTGTLAHVSTEIDSTDFVDNDLDPLTDYFYRVYVMDEFGLLGGSNIVSATTLNLNVLVNGSFETLNNSQDFAASWSAIGYDDSLITLENQNCAEGTHCVRFALPAEMDGREFWITQQVSPSKLKNGQRFRFSGQTSISPLNCPAELDYCDIEFSLMLRDSSAGYYLTEYWDFNEITADGQWETIIRDFTIPEDLNASNFEVTLHIIKWNEGDFELRLDDLAIEVAP